MEVRVVAPSGEIGASFVASLIDAFHAAHRRTFGYDYKGEQATEIVNLRVSGFGMIERPSLPKMKPSGTKAAPKGERNVWFDGAMHETKIYDRAALPVDTNLEGPVIVEEFGSTTVVFPGQTLTVDEYGIMILRQSKLA
jgi:N-methylhydantoinase A